MATRPIFLDLTRIRLPLSAIVSILHRMSGILLFVAIPLFFYLLQMSLGAPDEFHHLHHIISLWPVKLLLLLLGWALFHHLASGIRFLLLDIHIGVTLQGSRQGSIFVLAVSAILTLLWLMRLW